MVRAADKKKKKEAKKNPQLRKKLKKDPGVPSLWPFKERVLQQVEEAKHAKQDEKERRKELLREQQKQSALSLSDMVASAEQRGAAHEAIQQGETDNMAKPLQDPSCKAFLQHFKAVVEASDVILQVLDVRDPMGCRSKLAERLIRTYPGSTTEKKLIFVLNKIDLVPRDVADKWQAYLSHEHPTVLFKASLQEQRQNLGHRHLTPQDTQDDFRRYRGAIGADELLQLLKTYAHGNDDPTTTSTKTKRKAATGGAAATPGKRSASLKASLRVGIIGAPNVGKSSILNSLSRDRACAVGPIPGVTQHLQHVRLAKQLVMVDSPGVLHAGMTRGLLLAPHQGQETSEERAARVEAILEKSSPETWMSLYEGIPAYRHTTEFLMHLARTRGRLRKHGIADLDAAAKIFLTDWYTGRIPFYTLPPKQHPSFRGKATLVASDASSATFGQRRKPDGFVAIASMAMDDDEAMDVAMAGDTPTSEDDAYQALLSLQPAVLHEDDLMDDAASDDETAPALLHVDPAGPRGKRRRAAAKTTRTVSAMPVDEEGDGNDGYSFSTWFGASAAATDATATTSSMQLD